MNTHRLVALSLISAALAIAQSKPDFSGTWNLNVAESDFSDKRAPVYDPLVWTLRQEANHMTYKVQRERQGKKTEFEVEADIGGEPFESDAAGIVRFQWNGSRLALDILYNPGQDRQSSLEEIWTLSADGKKLTAVATYHMPKNAKDTSDVHYKRVFDKQ